MNFKPIFFIAFLAFIFNLSCKNDSIDFEAPTQPLRFSKDTVILDTTYHQVRSETFVVKVYNDENKDILIPKIALEGGAASPYKINVDGKAGSSFSDIPLRRKDSLYIFIEIAPVANAKEAIAEDRILFGNNGNQHITLLSVVQDAEFFIQTKNNANILSQNTTWTNNKAKVILGNLTLAEGKTLDIEAGTKIYFAKNSSLKLSKNSILNINGDLDNEVIMRGERNDPRNDTIPLNWKGITADENATLNINYAKIFGGETGISLKNGMLNIQNSIVYTFQNYGIEAVASTINAKNLVMNHCGQSCIGIFGGGTTEILHSTIANYWAISNIPQAYALLASNEYTNSEGTKVEGAVNLSIKNSILYNRNENAIRFSPTAGQNFAYTIDASLVKHGERSNYNWDNNPLITNSIKNENPIFMNSHIHKMNLRLKENSPAIGKGNASTAMRVPLDIRKNNRTTAPNMGAYQ